jgi:hypothetical protein
MVSVYCSSFMWVLPLAARAPGSWHPAAIIQRYRSDTGHTTKWTSAREWPYWWLLVDAKDHCEDVGNARGTLEIPVHAWDDDELAPTLLGSGLQLQRQSDCRLTWSSSLTCAQS